MKKALGWLAPTAIILAGCSTRPRDFVAQVEPPPGDEQAYRVDFETCRTLVRQGYSSNFKQAAASGMVGSAAGVGTAAVVAPLGMAGGAAGAAAAVAIPFVGIGIGFGVSRAIRSSRERKYKAALGGCLGEYGYDVSGWQVARKRDRANRPMAEADGRD